MARSSVGGCSKSTFPTSERVGESHEYPTEVSGYTWRSLGTALAATNAAAQQDSQAHTHIAHVVSGFNGAPAGRDFAATASAEIGVAMLHANFTAGDLSDLAAMRRHASHVLHLLDPAQGSSGPGLGFGVIPPWRES